MWNYLKTYDWNYLIYFCGVFYQYITTLVSELWDWMIHILLGSCSLPDFLYIQCSKRKSSCFCWQTLMVFYLLTYGITLSDFTTKINWNAFVFILGLNVSLQLLHWDMEQIRKDYMRLSPVTSLLLRGLFLRYHHSRWDNRVFFIMLLLSITLPLNYFLQCYANEICSFTISFVIQSYHMVMWPLCATCSNGLIMSLCS